MDADSSTSASNDSVNELNEPKPVVGNSGILAVYHTWRFVVIMITFYRLSF